MKPIYSYISLEIDNFAVQLKHKMSENRKSFDEIILVVAPRKCFVPLSTRYCVMKEIKINRGAPRLEMLSDTLSIFDLNYYSKPDNIQINLYVANSYYYLN